MDVLKIVENIQKICKERGTNPTLAGKESGAGKDLVSSMKRRGVLPSIEKMMLLADYLGVTVSELIGDTRNTLVTFQHILPPEDTVDAAFEEFSHKVPYFSQNFKSFIDGMDPPLSTRFSGPYTIFLDARLQNYDAADVHANGYGIVSSAGNTLSTSEHELLTRFRNLPPEQQEAFLEILRAVATGQNKS